MSKPWRPADQYVERMEASRGRTVPLGLAIASVIVFLIGAVAGYTYRAGLDTRRGARYTIHAGG